MSMTREMSDNEINEMGPITDGTKARVPWMYAPNWDRVPNINHGILARAR